jgi:tRNA pseudouridine65 synthase
MYAHSIAVLYEDEHLVVLNKPSGLLVHRSDIDRHETVFALQLARDQLNCRLYPVHRLDRPTSGALLMAKSPAIARVLSDGFAAHQIHKGYLAVVRGHPHDSGTIDYSLRFLTDTKRDQAARKAGTREAAHTVYECLATHTLPICIEKYPHSRYALLACFPSTGRRHQIRRHLKHISHPIIGDARYGRGRHNRYFAEHFGANRLLLHAHALTMTHPMTQAPLEVIAPLDSCMENLFTLFSWPRLDWPTTQNDSSSIDV